MLPRVAAVEPAPGSGSEEVAMEAVVLEAGTVSAIEYGRALLARTSFAERVRPTFERYHLLLTPQMPMAAWPADPGPFEGVADLGGRAHARSNQLRGASVARRVTSPPGAAPWRPKSTAVVLPPLMRTPTRSPGTGR